MALELDFSKLSGTDVLDMAIAIEDEAQLYYEQLADWVKKGTNGEAADFFLRMATREERHRQQIAAQRERLYGDAPASNAAKVSWAVEAPDYDAVPNDISLRQAFDVAMDAETRAEEFYAGAIEYAADDTLASLFEGLRQAEAEHKRLLEEEMVRLLP
jgi:rubrerythrin